MGLLRFILALSVLIVHSSPIFGIQIVPGYVAVQSFYIISGFYMAFIYTRKYTQTNTPVYNFYTNRFLRLYPMYFITILMVVVLSLLFGVTLGSWGKLQYYTNIYHQQPASLGSLVVVLLSNVTLIGQDIISLFEIGAGGQLHFMGLGTEMQLQELLFIPIAWTIAIEMLFYLATPFVVTKKIPTILVLIGLTLALRAILYIVFDVRSGFSIYRFAPTEFFWFLLGVLSFKLYERQLLLHRRYAVFLFIIWTAALFLYRFYEKDWAIFLLTFLCTPTVFFRTMESKTDKYLGDMAYLLYIGHTFLLMIVLANRFPKDYGTGLPLLVLTVLFSVACHHLILKPIDKIRSARVAKSRSSAGSMAVNEPLTQGLLP
jgi:peptidoglycan/LPS O-acetylase OafA/YrhL